jgi:hypothetical protein
VLRGPRGAESRSEALRAERLAATRSFDDEVPRAAPGAAALAQYNAALEGPLAKARFAVWAGGGVLSLALMAGIGIWGYKLVMREVLGLPVVQAADGPMRVEPADPGGQVVPQQGLAVNAIPAAGVASPPSDVLVLAPQTPGLADEDMEVVQTMAEADEVIPVATAVSVDPLALVEEPAPGAEAPSVATAALPESTPQVVALAAPKLVLAPPDVEAEADRLSMGATPLAPLGETVSATETPLVTVAVQPAPDVAAETAPGVPLVEEPPRVEIIPASVPGVAAAVRPAARPAALRTAAPAPAATEPTAAPAPTSSVALTAEIPSGTNLVQLGAFDSAEIAASEWERLQGPFGEFLGDKERVIQETQSNGRTLYRLRAVGFEDRAEARALCAALTAEDAACIPVTVD